MWCMSMQRKLISYVQTYDAVCVRHTKQYKFNCFFHMCLHNVTHAFYSCVSARAFYITLFYSHSPCTFSVFSVIQLSALKIYLICTQFTANDTCYSCTPTFLWRLCTDLWVSTSFKSLSRVTLSNTLSLIQIEMICNFRMSRY